jgi:hypothetical protein
MFEAKEIVSNNYDWVAMIFFAVLVLLVFTKNQYNNRLYHTVTLFFSKKYLSIYFNKEKTVVLNWFQISFFIIQSLIFSLLIYLTIYNFKEENTSLNLKYYLILLAGTVLYFGIRYVLGLFLAQVFSISTIHKKLLYEKLNYFNTLILWILPLMLILVYAQKYQKLLLISTLILVGILLIFRYALILKNNKNLLFNNLFYFILYLCALEIAPLVIIFKLTV